MRETTAAQCPIHPMETQPCPVCLATMDNSMASYNTGYAAGYRAAQEAMPPRELAYQCPNYGAMPPSLDHQPAATSVSGGATAAPSEATASVTDPAADPLPVAWATPSLLVTMSAVEKRRLTSPEMRGRGGEWEADARDADRYSVPLYRAAAIERLRAERDELRAMLQGANRDAARLATLVDKYKWQVRDTCTRAERAEAERDALREVVRAADAMRAREHAHDGKTRGCVACSVIAAYDERRAKWKDNT